MECNYDSIKTFETISETISRCAAVVSKMKNFHPTPYIRRHARLVLLAMFVMKYPRSSNNTERKRCRHSDTRGKLPRENSRHKFSNAVH